VEQSPILDKIEQLEKEVHGLCSRLEPFTLSTSPAAGIAETEPARSPVHERLNTMLVQLRSLQSRLEV